ncbi:MULTISPECIES: cysteine desulfurase family protein [Brevibacterium]|uniref:cysteine desulfurase n=2 Tax=Brevibacterium antiquum TaxID=234835 RepID=A0A2H1KSC8_9MICO|nr:MULTISPECIES: cysteine desulfurase family protein [Brevibacterium]SMX89050.1 cysteine desulfurase [Brevibacterium antiquum]SMY02666.1 cysteine desulfurase [Brevibacterium antiquum CNRZ 918]HCG54911.1 cysteine desulfurase [Brevibacterium sp.]
MPFDQQLDTGAPLYLDTASAAPVRKEALEAAWPYLTGAFGNPSSHHEVGRTSAEALKDARRRVAKVLRMRSTDIIFTSGGTESDNLAIVGIALGAVALEAGALEAGALGDSGSGDRRKGRPPRRHIVTSALEHEAVLASADFLVRRHGFEITEVPVESDGVITTSALRSALRKDTLLVSLGYANNEIGTVADIAALADVAHDAGAYFHTDAVQAAGWLPLSGLGVDAMSLAGHKVGAPKGIGVAAIRARIPLEPLIHGGGQESGRRSGTENVALAVAFAAALELAEAERAEAAERVQTIRDDFIAEVLDSVPGAFLTGSESVRTPNHASFCFAGTSGEAVLLELERLGITASSGSACAVGSDEPSHVLTALGIDDDVAKTSVRFTFSANVTAEQGRRAARSVSAAVSNLALSYT